MIRRDVLSADGRPEWLLISQVKHAEISGTICEYWSAVQALPADVLSEVLVAVEEHDDGWMEWEQAPEVDAETGRPREFTEMPLSESLVIWSRSIDKSIELGDLAPYMISGHFCALMHRFTHWRHQGLQVVALGEAFLSEQQTKQAIWLEHWRAVDTVTRTVELAQQAVRWLQLFDALSLWLCCAEQKDTQEFEPPVGPKFTLIPRSPEVILVQPWPFDVMSLYLPISGRRIPARKYRDSQELAMTAFVLDGLELELFPE
jgi:hypothetical protein